MSPKHVYKKSGRYIIKLFASNNISFDTLSKTIDIYGDSIQYKQINPPINLKTVRFFTPSENLMCNEKSPTPGDSITQCYLDIDMDSEMDFQIEVKHFLNTQIPGHCSSYEYDIVISALNPECTVSVKIKDWPFVKYYNNSDPITLSDFWYNARNVFLSQKGAFMSEGIILIDSYVGLKLKNRIGWLHVTPLPGNGISIIEYAINLEENRVIKAGQKY